MRAILAILSTSSTVTALVAPRSETNLTSSLDVRMNNQQQLINPDNEPPHTDTLSGNLVQKSRILSGVGPTAADNRYFDWDESCTDEIDRHKLYYTWEYFQRLTEVASSELAELRDELPSQPVGTAGNPNPQNVAYIKEKDPAYTQMFKARDTGLQWVQDSFALITNNVRNFQGRGDMRNRPVRFICNKDNHVLDAGGNPLCGTGPEASQARTYIPQRAYDENIEQKYRFQTTSFIVFCPVFFDDTLFPQLNDRISGNDPSAITLANVDCRERIMLHEYLHLPWVRNMNPERDYTGFVDAATVARDLTWNSVKSMPDCYAWYAVYSFFNNWIQGCGSDVWPPNVQKPVDTS